MSENKGNKGSKGWIWGAAIGTIVGSVTALLFAPKPGKELRKDIADGARQVGEKTQEVARQVGEKTQEVAGKVGEQGVQLASKVKDTAGGLIHDIQNWRASKEEEIDAEVKAIQVSSVDEEGGSEEEETVVIGIADEDGVVEVDAEIEAAAASEEEASVTDDDKEKA